MIDVATLSVIRRWALREHLSIREIARRTGLSRNTIRKYLRCDVVQPRVAQRMISTKLDPFASKLSVWGCQDDHGLAGPSDPPLPYSGNRQRQLPLQAQQCSPTTAHEEGEKQNLILILSRKAQAKGWVSLRWKQRVSFAWKSTVWCHVHQHWNFQATNATVRLRQHRLGSRQITHQI